MKVVEGFFWGGGLEVGALFEGGDMKQNKNRNINDY